MIYNDGQYTVISKFTAKSLVREKCLYEEGKEYPCSLNNGVYYITNELNEIDEYGGRNSTLSVSDFYRNFILNDITKVDLAKSIDILNNILADGREAFKKKDKRINQLEHILEEVVEELKNSYGKETELVQRINDILHS